MTPIMTHQLLPAFIFFTTIIVSGMSGALGTVPALLVETFGSKSLSSLFGTTLVSWALAGVVGSQTLSFIQQRGEVLDVPGKEIYIPFFIFIPVLLGFCLIASLSLRPYRFVEVLPMAIPEVDSENHRKNAWEG
ncbi:hypothetical protein GEMRC1_010835 [Eukaryota sp. GEM-RC1]